ncbi:MULTISPECIES: zinc ribbon domain-containing protein [unclassified Haladaptatus]|uniref:zinc ribbon domain-containing protein n=1 Tax=unclassified Haladaptatus TaxID=2622732 RepID=UPI0023E8C891|nr:MULTISPECIES: zinc ribbon domain-containing protein [unclassified Haladaptatus]
MTVPKITAVGAYAPRFRISAKEFAAEWSRGPAGIKQKSVLDADEDALTMAVEAGKRVLEAADLTGEDVAHLSFASSTPPAEEEELTARLGSMLAVSETATHQQFGGSTRAGTRALVASLESGPWHDSVGLVIASDSPRGHPSDSHEHAAGAGAVAFVLGETGAAVVSQAEYTTPYPGTRFRQRGSEFVEGLGVTGYDREAFSATIRGAVEQVYPGDVGAVCLQSPDGKLPYRAAKALGFEAGLVQNGTTVHDLGDTGAASAPLGIAKALDAGHERLLAVGYGAGGGADALVIEGDDVATNLALDESEEIEYAEYLRLRGDLTGDSPTGGGAYVSMPAWHQSLPHRHRLIAGKCTECGALAFPPEGACDACGHLGDYDPIQLPGTGTVEAVTRVGQGGAPPEFAVQQAQSGDFGITIVAFDYEGDTVSAPAQVAHGDLAVGDRVQAVIRRIYTQEGVTRYGFKVRPADGND